MIAPELFTLLFLFFVAGMLCGALVHAGLDERGVPERSWSPSWKECRRYKQDFKSQPIEKLAAEGKELKEFLEKIKQ
jgi:hypothetical protein